MTKILVWGWYNNNNLGDDLFVEAFRFLFPTYDFIFTNQITSSLLQEVEAVFIGGGSFLSEHIEIDSQAWKQLQEKSILYLGVGAETNLHSQHLQLMKLAKLIAIRSNVNFDKISRLNPNTIVIPDLVSCLIPTFSDKPVPDSVLVIPNIIVVPSWNEPHWKHAAWDYFKTEFAQFLDSLVQENITLHFTPFCTNTALNDEIAIAEIVGRMKHRNNQYFLNKKNSLSSITELMSRYNVIVTQRYHGIVLAELVGTPCLPIVHHNKLKTQENILSYYGLTKDELRRHFYLARQSKKNSSLPFTPDIFTHLQRLVKNALCSDQAQ
jgi:polysaccharide pyruvyl transferase WcaK-like protein